MFNKNWECIGDKKMLTSILIRVIGVPWYVLKEGFDHVISSEDDSLMGLLDANMLMLCGEGKKAFHRLQLEIIRTSNDQSIFAWGQKQARIP